MNGRAQIIETIANTLPGIMHRMIESRPLNRGEFELTLAQMRALRAVGANQPCTMGELAGRLGISLSAATGLVDRLMQHGLICRKSDPEDRRVVLVETSSTGRRAHSAIHKQEQQLMADALGELSREELEGIAASLSLLDASLAMSLAAKKEKQ